MTQSGGEGKIGCGARKGVPPGLLLLLLVEDEWKDSQGRLEQGQLYYLYLSPNFDALLALYPHRLLDGCIVKCV